MAGVSSRDGKITASKTKLIDNEPVFLIRGRDMLAVSALIVYARKLEERDRADEADAAFDAAMEMSEWQRDNPEKVKTTI